MNTVGLLLCGALFMWGNGTMVHASSVPFVKTNVVGAVSTSVQLKNGDDNSPGSPQNRVSDYNSYASEDGGDKGGGMHGGGDIHSDGGDNGGWHGGGIRDSDGDGGDKGGGMHGGG